MLILTYIVSAVLISLLIQIEELISETKPYILITEELSWNPDAGCCEMMLELYTQKCLYRFFWSKNVSFVKKNSKGYLIQLRLLTAETFQLMSVDVIHCFKGNLKQIFFKK